MLYNLIDRRMLVTRKRVQNGGYSFDKFDIQTFSCYYNVMWYVQSGAVKGISWQKTLADAFIEVFDNHIKQTGHFPEIGVLGAGSTQGFNFKIDNTVFFITEWALFEAKRIPRMSHEFSSVREHWESLFEDNLPRFDEIKSLVCEHEDAVLDDKFIDAPNSREDFWDDVIEVPENYEWPEDNADGDASLLGS